MQIRRASLSILAVVFSLSALLAVTSGQSAPAHKDKTYQIRGFSMQLNNPHGTDDYIKAIDDIHAMGCTAINFVIAARQDSVKSNDVRINWQNLPPMADIQKILKHAKSRGIYTILMPIVLLDTAGAKEWRGVIAPDDWDQWFWNYEQYMKTAATLARRSDVDLLCVGSELLSTETMRARWIKVITTIKDNYKGKLTYSANWDHYEVPTFWDQLDYIGMNNYNELAKGTGATVTQLNKNWEPIKKKIFAFCEKQKKPFLFTEVGWHNLENTIEEPWNYVADGKIDLEEQRRAYESFVETWQNVPTHRFMGALVWEWRPGANGAKDHGSYSIQGTPSMEIVKRWMHEQPK